MSTAPYQLVWGPGLIGVTVGSALYGIGVGQFVFYVRAFPRDMVQLKIMVFIVFVLDNIQTFAVTWTYYHLLIECRLKDTPGCVVYMPTLLIVSILFVYCITFIVQSFYTHRVWIISGRNRYITSAVFVSALAQLVLGLLCTAGLIHTPTYQVLFTIEYSPLAAIASALCDAIITISIMYYLRPARTGANRNRRGNYIRKLNAIFVQMGLLSFINSLAVAVMYYIQDNGVAQFLTAGPGIILSKTYVNSMLSVLNARKPIREEQEAQAQRTIEIPTISTIR
ncbi:hypothetical protein OG21DRAFT_1506166 [Imleria badia]|nr:hypothetical protein OG21DRAFT_1506166 [Imleria badia]